MSDHQMGRWEYAVTRDVSPNEKLILLLLAERANPQDGRCDGSVSSLSEESGIRPYQVQCCLHRLAMEACITLLNRSGFPPDDQPIPMVLMFQDDILLKAAEGAK